MHSRLSASGCLSPSGKGGVKLIVLFVWGSQEIHVTDQQCLSKEPNQLCKVSESIEARTVKLSISVVESLLVPKETRCPIMDLDI